MLIFSTYYDFTFLNEKFSFFNYLLICESDLFYSRGPCSKCLTPISLLDQKQSRYNSIPLVNPRGIRTIPFNNTLVSISIRTRLYLYQFPIISIFHKKVIQDASSLVTKKQLLIYRNQC